MTAIILLTALIFMCATLSQAEFSPKFQIEIKRYTYTCYFHYVLCTYLFTFILKILPLSNLPLSNI